MPNFPTSWIHRVTGAALCMAAALVSQALSAGVIIDGTRQIYPEQRREITVRLTNDDTLAPRLVQAWLDSGAQEQGPEHSDVPFTLSPPVFRLDPGKSQTMRLSYTRQPLPSDRESVFWLNVLEVPPAANEFDPALEEGERNQLRFAFRIRTKVFFRPTDLPGAPAEAHEQLRWQLDHSAKETALVVHNPSAYHVTFNDVALVMGARKVAVDIGMVEPGKTLRLPVRTPLRTVPPDAQVDFTYINDFGGFSAMQRTSLHR
ncbi:MULTISPECIES: molecular chaperone [Pseudomonas]|uniref:fimbrial biogenesis chaperone n=1 Tax=Pseudomonas TaxID=286 RepID=UPI000CFC78DF|nr:MULTISPECIES: fimbria/pilus periplasmic chaperone [Pseudomonas]PQZ93262.1 phytochrome sensor protein [Pseudomonas trivialis]PRB28583.1 phytochrome sensor protein [Pseudomonas sp. MYb60]